MYFPFRPIKGQAFTLYLSPNTDGSTTSAETALSFSDISKDGGTFQATTNSAVNITADAGQATTKSSFSLALTAAEMTADVISISVKGAINGQVTRIFIYTQPAELSAAPTLNSSIADKVTAIFQYLFFKQTRTSTAINLIKSDGSTTLASSTISDDATTVTKGAIS